MWIWQELGNLDQPPVKMCVPKDTISGNLWSYPEYKTPSSDLW